MSLVELFSYVRLRYAEIIGLLNERQVRPPDAVIFKAMNDIDAIIRPDYRRHTEEELTTLEANVRTLDAFIGPSPIGNRWAIFKAQTREYVSAARELV